MYFSARAWYTFSIDPYGGRLRKTGERAKEETHETCDKERDRAAAGAGPVADAAAGPGAGGGHRAGADYLYRVVCQPRLCRQDRHSAAAEHPVRPDGADHPAEESRHRLHQRSGGCRRSAQADGVPQRGDGGHSAQRPRRYAHVGCRSVGSCPGPRGGQRYPPATICAGSIRASPAQ